MQKRKPEYYEAGIYYFRNRKTGAAYVGASTSLAARIEGRLRLIDGISDPYGHERFVNAFKGCERAGIEIRILERVQVPTSEIIKRSRLRKRDYRKRRPGYELMLEREKFWIKKLRPSLNIVHLKDRLNISTLPVGAPEEITVQA